MLQVLGQGIDLVAHAPVHRLDGGARLQVDDAVGEEVEHLLADLLGVVPVFEDVAGREVVPYLVEVFDELVSVLVGLELLGHLGQRGRFEHVDDEHRVVGCQRASALGDDVGVWQVVLVGCLYEGVDTVVDVFLDGVVDGALAGGRARAVVVDTEAATAVDKLDVDAHLMQLDIELRGLAEGCLNAAYLRYLRSDVEMDELEAVEHLLLLQEVEGFEQLGAGQSELRGVAAALFPFAAARGGQLDAYAEAGADAVLLRGAGDYLELVHLLHDDEDALAHLLCQQGQFDIALVFIAVADDDGVALALQGDDGVELGFRAGFQTEVELPAVRDNLFDDGLHLVHLDGVDHVVLALVVVLLAGLPETVPRCLDTAVEDVGEPEQHGRLYVAERQLVHHLAQVYLRVVFTGRDVHIALFVHTEIGASPPVDVVQLVRVFNGPLLHIRICNKMKNKKLGGKITQKKRNTTLFCKKNAVLMIFLE